MLQLGRQIASSLDENDTLGHWLAHYIAELITTYEAADADAREVAGEKAVKTILKLWKHRRDRSGRRPLQSYEPVMAGLAHLGDEGAWGLEGVIRGSGSDVDELESVPLLRTALTLERAAHDVLLGVIVVAAEEAESREKGWLDAASGLKQDPEQLAIDAIRTRISRLMAADPRVTLAELSSADENADSDADDVVAGWLRRCIQAATMSLDEIALALTTMRPPIPFGQSGREAETTERGAPEPDRG